MQYLVFSDSTMLKCEWAAVAFNGMLNALLDGDMMTVLAYVSNPMKTAKMYLQRDGEVVNEFDGYVAFSGIQIDERGKILISLRRAS